MSRESLLNGSHQPYDGQNLWEESLQSATQIPDDQLKVASKNLQSVDRGSSKVRRASTMDQHQSPKIVLPESVDDDITRALDDVRLDSGDVDEPAEPAQFHPLQYHHGPSLSEPSVPKPAEAGQSPEEVAHGQQTLSEGHQKLLSASNSQPSSTRGLTPDPGPRGRQGSPYHHTHLAVGSSQSPRPLSQSPDVRSYRHAAVDLQRLPYAQQVAPIVAFSQDNLQAAVGNNASLLSRKKTLEMYRNNIKKTNDSEVQYTFAAFLVDTAQLLCRDPGAELGGDGEDGNKTAQSLFAEARQILQRLADRSYPFAQYYLADGLANGILNKGKVDDDKALQLFVAASKHGHAESAYRAALSYEYGWGAGKNPLKAAQYLRHAASKHHPGAMFRLAKACLMGDLGMDVKYREGVKWLKRAAEAADTQYNAAPFELGMLHEAGYGDDVFRDEVYAAQLFTQSAELGNADANYRLGDAYEHGKLKCPKDPSLSIHFYNGAALRGHSGAMMAICAWYMVGAPPVLEKDEDEAYEWAKRAAEEGLPKAQYAVGYFTEMGIGCRRDPLEANVWYVRAADQGDSRAKTRLAAIQAVYSGQRDATTQAPSHGSAPPAAVASDGAIEEVAPNGRGKKRWGIF